jgi:glycosyltransferase involved in cell wall biosynthesis
MNILHIAPIITHRPNGPLVSVISLCNALADDGHRIGLLPSLPLKDVLKTVNSNVFLLSAPENNYKNPWGISDDWFSIVEDKLGRPDFIDVHGVYLPFQVAFAAGAAKKKGWPYIVSPRCSFQMFAQKIKPCKKMFGNIFFANTFMQKASAIHALTKEEAIDISKYFPRAKIFIAPNGVSKEICQLSKSTQPAFLDAVPSYAFVLSFIGRISVWHKGLDLLFKALKFIEEHFPSLDIRLLLIGYFDSFQDERLIKKMIAGLKHPDRIIFLGTIMGDKKWAYLLRSDAFVHTSRFEGMPNAVLEAMAIGKACLLTPGTNMGDVIEKSSGGWIVDSKPEAIADKLVYMAGHRDQVNIRGKQARLYVQEFLTWQQVARSYAQQVEALM